jgi:hypothetical protein
MIKNRLDQSTQTKYTENRKWGKSRALSPNQTKKDYLHFEIGDQIQAFYISRTSDPSTGLREKKVPK